MTARSASSQRRRLVRIAGAFVLVGGLLLAMWGWWGRASGPVERVVINGATLAAPDSLRQLAALRRGAPMDTINEAQVIARVMRHPWVQHADVRLRGRDGTVAINVTERTPDGLVVHNGAPAFYVDATGDVMPRPATRSFDVPLVHGPFDGRAETFEAPAPLLDVLEALEAAPASDALVSSIVVQPDTTIDVHTVPVAGSGSIRVVLGRGRFPQKLRRVHAFLDQVLRADSGRAVEQLDVRFDGQVVARHRDS